MATPFPTHVHSRVVDAFAKIPPERSDEVYVLSLFVNDEDDDPRRPTVAPGYNTENTVREARSWTSDAEARWNFAFWEQVELDVIAAARTDPVGAELRQRWIKQELHAWYDDGGEFDERGEPITQAFVDLLVDVVQRMHGDGIVAGLFGRTLPVLIHELEYYDRIAQQNLRANPPGVVPQEFVDWCHGIG